MKLWTCMPQQVYQHTLGNNIPYICNPDQCDMLTPDTPDGQIRNAYDWMAEQLKSKVGTPDLSDIQLPVWAWYRLRGRQSRPDLRWTEFRFYDEPMVLLEIEKDDSQVLLSDEERWTWACLNNVPCYNLDDTISEQEFNRYHNMTDVSARETWKRQTWQRIFDIEEAQHVQAVFWILYPNDVKNVQEFHTAHQKDTP